MQDLKDHFRPAGDVVYTDSYNDGTGIVEFSRYEDFKRALRDMDDSKFRSHEVRACPLTNYHVSGLFYRGRLHTSVLKIRRVPAVPHHINVQDHTLALALGPGLTEQLQRKLDWGRPNACILLYMKTYYTI